MRIENWKEFKHDCDLLGYDVFTAETEAQLQYNDDAWDDTIDYTDADGVRVYMEKVKPAYYTIMRGGEIVRDVPEDELTADDWDNEEFYPEETAEAVFHYDNIISRLESAIYDAWDGLTDDEKKAAFERFAETVARESVATAGNIRAGRLTLTRTTLTTTRKKSQRQL